MPLKYLLMILSLLLSLAVNAESNIYTIELKHRLASEILPELQNFIPENATIQAYNNTLILKSDPATLNDVKQLLDTLDQAQQSLMVTVVRTSEAIKNQDGTSTHVRIEADEDITGSVRIESWSTKNKDDQNQEYRAVGISGQPISISIGKDIPNDQHLLITGPLGVGITNNTEYISVDNGFKAISYLLPDDRVKVEIYPFFSRESHYNDDIHRSNIVTTLTGRINEWLEVGRTVENSQINQHGSTTYSTHQDQQQIVYLKVNIQN